MEYCCGVGAVFIVIASNIRVGRRKETTELIVVGEDIVFLQLESRLL